MPTSTTKAPSKKAVIEKRAASAVGRVIKPTPKQNRSNMTEYSRTTLDKKKKAFKFTNTKRYTATYGDI